MDNLGAVIASKHPLDTIEFINSMINYDDFTIYNNVSNMKELGEEAAFRFDKIDPDSPIGQHINFEEYGKAFHDVHEGIFTSGKYIIPPTELKQRYDGGIAITIYRKETGNKTLMSSGNAIFKF